MKLPRSLTDKAFQQLINPKLFSMKKLIFTFFIAMNLLCARAATWYWVGGASGTWGSASSWSNTSGGAPSARVADPSDILIFDAASGAVVVQPATNETVTQLQVLAGGNLTLSRSGSSGTTNFIVSGSLKVEAGAVLTVTNGIAGANMGLILSAGSFSTIYGDIIVSGTGSNRLSSQALDGLQFGAGSSMLASSAGTNNFGSTSASTLPAVDKGVRFLAGSVFKFRTSQSIYGSSSLNNVLFDPHSTFRFEAPIPSSFFGSSTNPRPYGNIVVANNQVSGSVAQSITFNSTPASIDTIIVEAGNTLLIRETGATPVTGSIIVQPGAVFGANPTGLTTSNIVFIGGGALQTIGGGGTFNPIGVFTAATDAHVNLLTDLVLNGTSTGSQSGYLNAGTHTVTGSAAFQFRSVLPPTNSAATTTSGSYTVALDPAVYSSSVNTANVSIGYKVTGAGIPAGTYIVATSSGSSQFTLSKPATATAASLSGSVTITAGSGTLDFNNAGGIGAAIAVSGARSFGTNTNYIFNAVTNSPFVAGSTSPAQDVTFNAPVTANTSFRVNGTLTLNAMLSLPAFDTLQLSSSGMIANASPAHYIRILNDGTNSGQLIRTGFTAATDFPVGTAGRYMPVTVTPATGSADFQVNVFEGITQDGSISGIPYTSLQKADAVDAVWTISRTVGSTATDPCNVTINWDAALEGSNFTSFSDAQVGITRYNGTIWEDAAGTGNNSANTATASFTNFSPFSLAKKLLVPVQFISVNAAYKNGGVHVNWQMANDDMIHHYVIERAGEDLQFQPAGEIASRHMTGTALYDYDDMKPLAGTSFYRIRATGLNGEIKYSAVVKISISSKQDFAVLQNPVCGKNLQTIISGMNKGQYKISLFNTNGQKVFETFVNHQSSVTGYAIQLPASVARGLYRAVLSGGGVVRSVNVMIE